MHPIAATVIVNAFLQSQTERTIMRHLAAIVVDASMQKKTHRATGQ